MKQIHEMIANNTWIEKEIKGIAKDLGENLEKCWTTSIDGQKQQHCI